jgi:hypothetical protein
MKKQYFIYLALLLAGFGIGLIVFNATKSKNTELSSAPAGCPYKLINPLRCGEDAPEQTEYSVFKKKLLEELAEKRPRVL